MLNIYVKATEALKSLRADRTGVVSFEYVVVAACVVGAVALAFGTGAAGNIAVGLSDAIADILAKVALATS